MKKIFTLLSAVVIGAASLVQAAPVSQTKSNREAAGFSQEFVSATQQLAFDAKSTNFAQKENTATRSWFDAAGNYWTAQFLFSGLKAPEAFTWTNNETGKPMDPPTFEEEPGMASYVVFCILSREGTTNANGGRNEDLAIQYAMFWPSHLLWDQQFLEPLFDNEGNLLDPSKADFSIVDFEEMANTSEYCRTFREYGGTSFPWPTANEQGTAYVNFPILVVGGSVTNNNTGVRDELKAGDSATAYVDFLGADGENVQFEGMFAAKSSTASYNLPLEFEGSCRVDGFSQKNIPWGKLGGIHVFDCGVSTYAANGTKWSGTFDDVQKYMVWGYDELIKFTVTDKNQDGTPVTSTKCADFRPYLGIIDEIPEGTIVADHLNYFRAMVYSAKGEGPQKNIWTMTYPEKRTDAYFGEYTYYAPTANCIITYASEPKGCTEEGFMMMYHDYSYNLNSNVQLGIGTLDGFQLYGWDEFNNYISVNYTGEITFHNDPNNFMVSTTFQSIGDLEIDGVEEVETSENVAPVYYNLQGVRVNNPENGLYIEVRGKEARKVVVRK